MFDKYNMIIFKSSNSNFVVQFEDQDFFKYKSELYDYCSRKRDGFTFHRLLLNKDEALRSLLLISDFDSSVEISKPNELIKELRMINSSFPHVNKSLIALLEYDCLKNAEKKTILIERINN